MSITDADHVRAQYASEANLDVRRSAWLPTVDGRHPGCEALNAVVSSGPSDVLEVGCGTGEFAVRVVDALPSASVRAVDQSERMVELARSRGVSAKVADVQALPFPDDSFDVVAALWMLYHVPDLALGLSELRRVLRPGGTLVAVTNGEDHLADLRLEAGGEPSQLGFSGQNGAAQLAEHFDDVSAEEFATRAVFADHDAAMAYLRSSAEKYAWRLPEFDGPREYAGHVTLFVAR